MSFTSAWVYTLPGAYNPVVSGTRITTAWANNTLNDIATALNALGAMVGIPQIAWPAGAKTLAIEDNGKQGYKTDAANVTVPLNATVALPVGFACTIVNNSASNQSVLLEGGVTAYLAGTASTGTRTIAQRGMATAVKVATDTWFITGPGVS